MSNLGRMRQWIGAVPRNPCGVLLITQALGVLIYPWMEGNDAGRAAFAMFGILVLAMAVLAVRATPGLTWVSTLIAIPAVVLLMIQVFHPDTGLFAWSSAFEGVLYFYAAFSMLAYMLRDEQVSTDEMFAIGAVFTLLAWAFTYVYVVLQALDPGSFGHSGSGNRTWMELLFLSFTTLSSTGLSDITPVSGHARSVVMIEEVAGVFYIAMVVTRLIGLRAARVKK